MKEKNNTQTGLEQIRPQVVPYTHCVAHSLKKVAFKYDVFVVFLHQGNWVAYAHALRERRNLSVKRSMGRFL